MTARSRRLAVVLALVALGFSGCTETPSVVRSSSTPTAIGQEEQPAVPNPDLTAQKRAAGIADCPATDTAAIPVVDGLPDLTLECLGGGRPVRLAGLRGQPMVINLWAQWCAPCREEAPYLAEIGGSATVRVLGVDHADPRPEAAVQFAGEAGWRYPQLYDGGQELGAALQLPAIPVTLFVRADGTIAYRNFVPFRSTEQIRELVRTHLGVTP